MEPSLKHQAIKKLLDTSVKSLGSAVPKAHQVRGILELATAFRSLPWGVHFERVQFGSTSGLFVAPEDAHPDRIMLYLHGGGYTIGSSNTHRSLVGSIAKACKMQVFLIDYRKAPEHPFPAALNDAVAAYRVLLEAK